MNTDIGTVTRGKYSFSGDKANDSAKYYDIVISHGYHGDTDYLAWDAAHKFGSRMTAVNMASFRNGIVFGENALEAAEYIDTEYKKAYLSCEEYGRSKRMKELTVLIYSSTEEKYGIKIMLF